MKVLLITLMMLSFQSCGYLDKNPGAQLAGGGINWNFETIEAPMKFLSGVQYAQGCAEIVGGLFSPRLYSTHPNFGHFQKIRYSMTQGGVDETLSGAGSMLTYWSFAEAMCRNTINERNGVLLGLNLNRSPTSIPNNEIYDFVNRLMLNAYGYNDVEEAAIIKNFITSNAAQFNALTPGSARGLYKQACVLVLLSVGMNGV